MPNPICPTNCEGALAVISHDECAPVIVASEIKRVFFARPTAAPFTDWKLAPEWTERISDTDITDPDSIRAFTVTGDKPAPSGVVKDISNKRKWYVGKDHTVNFTIDDVTDENYEFMRVTECGGKFRMWYETHGGYIYGGNEGILVNVTMDDILNRGLDEIETINGVATWRAKFSPERTLSPIYTEA